MKKSFAISLALAFSVACSSGEPGSPGAGVPVQESEEKPGSSRRLAPRSDGAGSQRKQLGRAESARSQDPARPSTTRPRAAAAGNRGGDRAGLALPDRGRYDYSQEGWEEFCQSGSCDRRDLPRNQEVQLTLERRSPQEAILISEADASGSRSQKVTYLVGARRVSITDIKSSYSYRGVSFESHLEPDPAIVSARLPLEVGDSWSGSWEDRRGEMDGSYAMRVARREQVEAGGRSVDSFVLDVKMTFAGDYEGTSHMTIWAAPRDLTILGTKGRMNLNSSFGTYRTRFTSYYRSGP